MYTRGRMGDDWVTAIREQTGRIGRELLLWKVGVYENTPVRCTIHTHTQHTHNSFYTVIMLQRDLMLVFFFFYFSITLLETTTTSGSKTAEDRFLQKEIFANWVSILNGIKSTLYSRSHTENSWQASDTFWAITLWEAGQSISISIPGVCDSLHSKVAFSLDYKPHFFKT